MGDTPICTIDATGIHRPSLATVLAWATAKFQAIYGADVYLGADSQDGEWLGLLAAAIDDANAMCVSAYNSFSPATAQGVGLSSNVKLNGIKRKIPSFSTAPVLCIGVAGTVIANGLVTDANRNVWALPASVTIPFSGQILVTATCETTGAVSAPAGSISTIANTQPGWQSATNTADATPGAPVEVDAQLRQRQSISTMNASTGILQGITGALAALPNVARVAVYENEDNLPDQDGVPGHCIAAVLDGGDLQAIAQTIKSKKGGCGTYGSTSQTVTSVNGIPSTVNFFLLAKPQITATITIRALDGFVTDTEALIQNSVAAWGNQLAIGKSVQLSRLYAPSYLFGALQAQTFEVQSILLARDGAVTLPQDVPIAFNEAASFLPESVTVVVLTS